MDIPLTTQYTNSLPNVADGFHISKGLFINVDILSLLFTYCSEACLQHVNDLPAPLLLEVKHIPTQQGPQFHRERSHFRVSTSMFCGGSARKALSTYFTSYNLLGVLSKYKGVLNCLEMVGSGREAGPQGGW